MDEFASILHRDYGLKPQGKSVPMSSAKSGLNAGSIPAPNRSSSSSSANPTNGANRTSSLPSGTAPNLADDLLFFGAGTASQPSSKSAFASASADLLGGSSAAAFGDVFGGPPSYTPAPSSQSFDDVFRPTPQSSSSSTSNKNSSLPVFDAPLYDDDIFGGVPGIRSAAYDDIFNLGSKTAEPNGAGFDDLLGGFSSFKSKDNAANSKTHKFQMSSSANSAFDELLPGFGGTEPAKPGSSEDDLSLRKKSSEQVNGAVADDPFTVFESSGVTSTAPTSSMSGIDPFGFSVDGFNTNGKSSSSNGHSDEVELESSPLPYPIAAGVSNKSFNAASNFGTKEDTSSPASSPTRSNAARESKEGSSVQGNQRGSSSFREHRRVSPNTTKSESDVTNKDTEAGSSSFRGNMPTSSSESMPDSHTSSRSRQVPREPSPNHKKAEASLSNGRKARNVENFWITIEDVKLVTQPTSAPPPSRPPPAPCPKQSGTSRTTGDVNSSMDQESTKQNNFSTTQEGIFPETSGDGGLSSSASIFDGFEEFAAGGGRSHKDVKSSNTSPSTVEEDQTEGSAAATASGAAMREAIERAEAKLRQVKEAKDREREELKDTRDRGERDKSREAQEKGDDGEGREQERLRRERETRERRRVEREKEKEKEREREREKDRIAVEKANEARERAAVERAAAEARERAAAKAAERAAVERVASEARARAERAAVERATAEARERAAAEARDRAEKAAAQAREKAEKMAAEKAAAEACKKKEAAERAAAAREQQQRTEDDLEAFFMSSTRPASAPRQRTQNTDAFPAESQWKSVNLRSNVKKVPSASSMADDLASIFGGPATTSEFQEIEGESEERRRARLERIQRTRERADKALKEKHQRDLLSQKEQAERHRAAELVDAEIKRWAAGKEGNLRALLSTLQYVLWPECGWQPVSLTDLITAAAVKKVYRKATLYVHPDKVQQKGATVQQKYIAEKVFDLLKEAWNKFNSEELF